MGAQAFCEGFLEGHESVQLPTLWRAAQLSRLTASSLLLACFLAGPPWPVAPRSFASSSAARDVHAKGNNSSLAASLLPASPLSRSARAQVFGGDKGKTRRVANLQSDVAALEAAIEAARAEYDRVIERNLKVCLTHLRHTFRHSAIKSPLMV